MALRTFPILPAARRAGLPVSGGGRQHVNCPFCGDTGRRLYLYPDTQQYHCFRCRAHGNAVSLYARCTGLSPSDAYHALAEDSVLYFPKPAARPAPSREPAPPGRRDEVYRALLGLLPLSAAHYENLRARGLDDTAIYRNGYRTLGAGRERRDSLAARLSARFDLCGVPGFFYDKGAWRTCAYSGLLIPVCATDGRIQGIQIRRDNAERMRYVWMSSAGKPYGTAAKSWIHVAGDRSRTEAIITEGPLKGGVSSFLSGGALFVCVPGVNAVSLLPETLRALPVTRAKEAFDMDKLRNPQVTAARKRLQRLVRDCGIPCGTLIWNEKYKGIDDWLLAGRTA